MTFPSHSTGALIVRLLERICDFRRLYSLYRGPASSLDQFGCAGLLSMEHRIRGTFELMRYTVDMAEIA